VNGPLVSPQLEVVGILRRQKGAAPVCVVRWVLGKDGNELPYPNDIFDVELTVDGVAVPGASRVVSPKNYVMLDPTRIPESYPPPAEPEEKWAVAQKPTTAIDPSAADDESLVNEAVGVIHLLKPTTTPRMRYRAAAFLCRMFKRAAESRAPLNRISDRQLVASAVVLANWLVRSDVRPIHLPQLAAAAFSAVRTGEGGGSFLRLDSKDRTLDFAYAALVLEALTIPGVATALDVLVDQSRQVRNHIRVAALQGGEMVDYWCDPLGEGLPLDERGRGKRYPASELIGLGCRIPLDAGLVESWITGKKKLLVTVRHRPRSVTVAALDDLDFSSFSDLAGEIHLDDDVTHFAANERAIDWDRMKRAMLLGSSHPPLPPSGARIDWSMVRVEVDTTGSDVPTEPSTSSRTADGKVEIQIDAPPKQPARPGAGSEEQTVAAYNIYGVWEGAQGFDAYFKNSALNPTLEELRPWLMTRRYSHSRDLRVAFPPIGGIQHPALTEAVQSPHWHPLLKRPDILQDTLEANTRPLPDITGTAEAVFTVDLRAGMGMQEPHRPPKGWDLAAPLAVAWRPEHDRDLKRLPAGQLQPQRYRFWVTSVDPFEQESDPVPVRTEDVDLKEAASFIFAPTRRSQISAQRGDKFTCAFEEPANQIRVTFETPYEGQISGWVSGGATTRLDKLTLHADVVLFRRLLTRRQNAVSGQHLLAAVKLPALPQWESTAVILAKDRWRPFGVAAVPTAKAGDTWEGLFKLGPDDRGWEYLAAVGFTVRASHAGFWGKSAIAGRNGQGRRLVRFVPRPDGKGYESRDVWIDETPSASSISLSQPSLVSDPKAPWWPEIKPVKIWPAAPVSAPPGVRRDLVLQRLLDRRFTRHGVPVDRSDWGEASLTIGQIAMCENSLRRTKVNGSILDPQDPILRTARRILAQDFDDGNRVGLRQHATVGFRGLADLEWKYSPRSSRPAGDAGRFSEAAAFRIYCTTLPHDASYARNFATLVAEVVQIKARTYAVTLKSGDADAWHSIAALARPTAVELLHGGQRALTNILTAQEAGGVFTVEFAPPASGVLPPKANAFFYVAQPLADVNSDNLDQPSSYRLLLPVPGGGEATFVWWVYGVSAAGAESPRHLLGAMQSQRFPRTTEPEQPAAFNVGPATDNSKHFLDPSKHAKWLPKAVNKLEDAKSFARVVLTWTPPDTSDRILLEVQREARLIAKPQMRMQLWAKSAWDALKSIESAPDDADLAAEDLELLADWLLGNPIDVPESPVKSFILFGENQQLSAVDGIIKLPVVGVDGAVRNCPALVDYFGLDSEDRMAAMDGNWDYRYRLRTFIDLGGSLPDRQRYLYSSPTLWSPNVAPETPRIRLKPKANSANMKPLQRPVVRLVFDPSVASFTLGASIFAVPTEHRWEYRIVVRRKIDAPSFGDPALADAAWIDVGRPLTLRIGEQSGYEGREIVDEEVDRHWPTHAPTIQYRVYVQQFMIVDDGQGLRERLVRGFESGVEPHEIPILLPAPTSRDAEIEVVEELQIE